MKFLALFLVGAVLTGSASARAEAPIESRPAPTAAETAATPPDPEKGLRGWNIDLRTSLVLPMGSFADEPGLGMGDFGPGAGVALTLGGYLTPHVGVLGGFRGTFGHDGVSGCHNGITKDSNCGGSTLQIPLLVEYAFVNRRSGLYARGGVGLFTTYKAYGDAGKYSFSNDYPELKAGIGYRIEGGPAKGLFGLDVFVDGDVGKFTSLSAHTASGGVDGDVASDKRAYHAMIELGVGIHFSP
jgi:hypothetical protein